MMPVTGEPMKGQEGQPMMMGQGGQPMMIGQGGQPMMMGQGGHPMMMGQGGHPMMMGQGGHPMMMGQGGQPMMMGQGGYPMMMGQGGYPMMMGQGDMMGPGDQPMMTPSMFQHLLLPSPSQIPEGTLPGLEYLLETTSIMIQQQVELTEVLTGINTNNRYNIFDQLGRRIYFAAENSDGCGIMCLGNRRPWIINIYDCFGEHILVGTRRSSCCGSCGNCVQVTTPLGEMVGGIIQNCESVSASWDIMDSAGISVLRLQAPTCSVCCPSCATCVEAEFPLLTKDKQKVGSITKKFENIIKELYTSADTFGVDYPMSFDVKLKATLLFATFMIDFMYYEDKQPHNSRY